MRIALAALRGPAGRITLGAGCVVFLLFFRARHGFQVYSPGDDTCYMAWLYRLFGQAYAECPTNSYMPGAALGWVPAGLLASVVSWASAGEFKDWITPLVGLNSLGLWVASLGALYSWLASPAPDKAIDWRPLLMILNVPILYYVTHRATMSHAAELCWGALMALALARHRLSWAILFAALMTVTRVNDFPVFLMVLGAAHREHRLVWRSAFGVTLLAAMAALGGVAVYIAFVRGYNGMFLGDVLMALSPAEAVHVLVGANWGLVWTAPFWLMALLVGVVRWRKLSWTALGGLVWMVSQLVISIGWKGNGSDFAYRYLIGSYIAAIWVWKELLEEDSPSRRGLARLFAAVAAVGAVWVTYLTWVYKTRPELNLLITARRWDNPELQLNALHTLGDPTALLRPLYWSPLGETLFYFLYSDDSELGAYAMSGVPLGILISASIVAIIGLVWSIFGLPRRSTASAGTSQV